MWKAEKGFTLKHTSVLGTAFPLVGAGKERRCPHIFPFSGLLFGMPHQAWGSAQALDPTFQSSSYWHYPQAECAVMFVQKICCPFLSILEFISHLFGKAPPILYSTSFLITAAEIQS